MVVSLIILGYLFMSLMTAAGCLMWSSCRDETELDLIFVIAAFWPVCLIMLAAIEISRQLMRLMIRLVDRLKGVS